MKRRTVLIGLGSVALCGAAAPTPWSIVRDVSTIEMSVRAFGGTHRGRFDEWRGDIAFDPEAPTLTKSTVVVQAGSLKMNPAAITGRATGSAFLDVQRYPEIRFNLKALEPLGGGRYSARADVTVKGVTRPIAFPVDLRVTGDRAHLTGAFDMDRTQFGIGTTGAWNRMVGRNVTVRVALQARRGQA